MIPYPQTFPVDAAKVIVSAVMAKTVQNQLPQVAHAAWQIIGYGLATTIGDPSMGVVGMHPLMLKQVQSMTTNNQDHIDDDKAIDLLKGLVANGDQLPSVEDVAARQVSVSASIAADEAQEGGKEKVAAAIAATPFSPPIPSFLMVWLLRLAVGKLIGM